MRYEIFSADLDATADFYTRVLGFAVTQDDRAQAPAYLALARDDVHVGILDEAVPNRDARRPPVGVELVLEVDDVDAEHRRVADAPWPVEEEMTERPWGLRDFRVLDADGYYLRITSRR